MANVVLATTFWDQVPAPVGEQRETQLKSDRQFWQPMIAKGSHVERLKNDQRSNLKILMHIAANNKKFFLQAQEEMLSGKTTKETTAAQQTNIDYERIQADYRARLQAERWRAQQEKQEMEREAASAAEVLRKEMERKRRHEEAKQLRLREEREERERKRQKKQEKEDKETRRKAAEKAAEVRRLERQLARERREEEAAARRRAIQKAHICHRPSTKRWSCDACDDRLDKVGSGNWCYRKYFLSSPSTFTHCTY